MRRFHSPTLSTSQQSIILKPYSKNLPPIPSTQSIQQAVRRQVELQWGDRDVACRQRAEIGAFFGQAGGYFAADPVIRLTARVLAAVEHIAVDGQALARGLKTLDLVFLQV